ncbi:MAG: phosphate ABC transporter substrate-binding protein [Symploca sp. SIO3E6]|nr:phosphate ABC transporter substrate-binding protein [Caldora sp. SIO3E6]
MKLALLRLLILTACFCGLLQGCTSSQTQDQKLTLTGASTIAPLVTIMGKRFETQNPRVQIDVQTGGSTRGLVDAKQGLADIGMVSRSLTATEQEGLQVFLIGLDGISIIVHKDNPLNEMTQAQIQDIYSNRVNNWKDLGGKDAPITVVHKAAGHSTLDLFLQYVELENLEIQADVIIGDNQQGIKTVVGNPNAIGYVSIGSAEYDAQQGVAIKLLTLDEVAPSAENVAKGTFPLLRELNLVTYGESNPLAQKFIKFMLAQENHDLIEQQNFVPPQN